VLKNVVSYEPDVKSVLTKIALGEGDAGVVYVTDAATKKGSVTPIAIPDALNGIAVYPIAPVKGCKHADVAQQFVDYVASSDGQAVLVSYGFVAGDSGPQHTPPAGT
jgi:molybdate transport system substrate-binding protein